MNPEPYQRPMNEEFGRRIADFLTRGTWWNLVKLAASEMPPDQLWTVVAAGLNLEGEDRHFAQCINWSVLGGAYDISNVADYKLSNWWYIDTPSAQAAKGASLTVTGHVNVHLKQAKDKDDAKKRATQFVLAVVDPLHLVDGTVDVVPEPQQGETAYRVPGTAYFR